MWLHLLDAQGVERRLSPSQFLTEQAKGEIWREADWILTPKINDKNTQLIFNLRKFGGVWDKMFGWMVETNTVNYVFQNIFILAPGIF